MWRLRLQVGGRPKRRGGLWRMVGGRLLAVLGVAAASYVGMRLWRRT
jgi:hypothetical protein